MSYTRRALVTNLTKLFSKTTKGFSFGVCNLTHKQPAGVIVDWMVIGTAK